MDQTPGGFEQAEADTIITALYRIILKREPDPKGLQAHALRLRSLGGLAGLETMLQAFLVSNERVQLEKRSSAARLTGFSSSGFTAPPIRHLVSLGTHCYASQLLKQHGLKRWSGPFDWIFSSPGMIRHCLADNFACFLDPTQYEVVFPDDKRPAFRSEHRFYRDRFGVTSMFNHHNMAEPAAQQYFLRAVNRFRAAAASKLRTLLLQCLSAKPDTRDEFTAMAESVSHYAPRACLLTVAVDPPDPNAPMPRITEEVTLGNHRLFRLVPLSELGPLSFGDALDELPILRLLSQYPIGLQYLANP